MRWMGDLIWDWVPVRFIRIFEIFENRINWKEPPLVGFFLMRWLPEPCVNWLEPPAKTLPYWSIARSCNPDLLSGDFDFCWFEPLELNCSRHRPTAIEVRDSVTIPIGTSSDECSIQDHWPINILKLSLLFPDICRGNHMSEDRF